jgi:hypothetical protein
VATDGLTRQSRRGGAGPGAARRGLERQSRLGWERRGKAWRGEAVEAWIGEARHVEAGIGKATEPGTAQHSMEPDKQIYIIDYEVGRKEKTWQRSD